MVDIDALQASKQLGTPEVEVVKPDASQEGIQENAPEEELVPQVEGESKEPDAAEKSSTPQRNIEAEVGKIKYLEKELATKSKEREAYKSIMERVDMFFRNNKPGYELLRQHYKESYGKDPGAYEDVYGGQAPAQMQQQTVKEASSLTPDAVKRVVAEEITNAKVNDEINQGFGEFLEAYPQLDPAKMDEAEREKFKSGEWNSITQIAIALKARSPGMTMGNALKRAYQTLNMDGEIEKAKTQAELSASQRAISGGVTSSHAVSTQEKRVVPVKLTPFQSDRYESIKKTSPTAAKLYLENIRAMST
jgi:hypothetical protein